MRGRLGAAAALLVHGLFCLGAAPASDARQPARQPSSPAAGTSAPGGRPGYEGSETCATCHETEYRQWKRSGHAQTVHPPSDSEKQLLSRALLCGDEDAEYVLGEHHARRFMVSSPTEPGRHVLLPCRYDVGPGEWVGLHQSDWKTLSWEKSCGACHTAGFRTADFSYRELGVGCEACHGPGSRHADHATRGGMVAFEKVSAKDEATVCASCHLQGGKSKTTGLSYPRDYEAGGDLFADYAFDWSVLDAAAPETKTGASQPAAAAANPIDVHQKLLMRDAVVKGREGLRCTSCHEFHEMGHEKHEKLARQDFCYLCHERADFKLKDYNQSCNVCEF